jgi:hypothetical protein
VKFLTLPSYKEIAEYLVISKDSPSGLRWIKSPARSIQIGQIAGSLHKNGYWDVHFKNITYKAHRIIYLLQNKQDPGEVTIDHVHGKNNVMHLRTATHSQNMHNRDKTKSKATSKFKGVYWCKQKQKWKARIYVNKKQMWLGSFDTEIDAAKAYNKAALIYIGEFACINNVTI